jgi:chorismate-pyruvate lyase
VAAARSFIVGAVLALAAGTLARAQPRARPDTLVSRVEALTLMQTLNDELLASRSATQTLEQWCGDRHLAAEPRIVAHLMNGVEKQPDADRRQHLRVAPAEPVKYRRVQLRCGTHVLSEAENWYVPGRLTAEMNRLLETSETPFGTVVRPLEPYRQTLAVTMFWSSEALPIPVALFAHRAVLYTRDRVPFSEVYEIYQRDILGLTP